MVETVTLETAKRIMDVAEQEAKNRDVEIVVTVANAEGNIVGVHRMDGAALASVNVSIDKAYSAAALQGPTHEVTEMAEPGGSAYGLQTCDDGRLITFGGGFPLERDGDIVGALGVSGAPTETDMEIASVVIGEFESIEE
jgi:uncharacterized protein GlcG (DUF336 family)